MRGLEKETVAMHDLVDGKRNRFVRGKRMHAEDYDLEQDYGIARRRLINRAVLGWGVVQGFALWGPPKPKRPRPAAAGDRAAQPSPAGLDAAIETMQSTEQLAEAPPPPPAPPPEDGKEIEGKALWTGRGFALDQQGREVVRLEDCVLSRDNTFLLHEENGCLYVRDIGKLTEAGHYVLAVHYAEEKCGGHVDHRPCDCGRPERGYVSETAVFSLRRVRHCPCGDPGCQGDGCKDCEACPEDACKADIRGPHARLSEWITHRDLADGSRLECWSRFEVALRDGVDLACLDVRAVVDDCKPLEITQILDHNGPRRLVKNNDLLFDLIRGCDLTYIKDITWKDDLHRKIKPRADWATFAGYFLGNGLKGGQTGFVLTFTRPVRIDTLQRDVVAMTAYFLDSSTGWRNGLRVPITDLEPINPSGDHADGFRVIVRSDWVDDEIEPGGKSHFEDENFYVEFEFRASLVKDCADLTVAATYGERASAPGGVFTSSFRVKAKERPTKNIDSE